MIGQMDYDFDIWYKTTDPMFSEISRKSRIPEKWISFQNISKNKFNNSIIKPINKYVEALVPPPKLISIIENTVTLQQGNHAEFFLLNNAKTNILRHIDRPWMRQYYNTKDSFEIPNDCFNQIFKFYAPWYIDANASISYTQPKEESSFHIYQTEIEHNFIKMDAAYLEPDFIPFSFKKEGSHMLDDVYGKIKRQTPMFDIVFQCDDIMLKRVKEFYEQD